MAGYYIYTYTVGTNKSSGFRVILCSQNSLTVAVLNPFIRADVNVAQPFYRCAVFTEQPYCLLIIAITLKNGCTMPSLPGAKVSVYQLITYSSLA